MLQDIIMLYYERWDFFMQLLLEHIQISSIAIILAAIIGTALGLIIAEHPKLSVWVLGTTNIIYTIPSIALLGALIPFTGIGNTTAIIALTVYALLPMVRNTCTAVSYTHLDVYKRQHKWWAEPKYLLQPIVPSIAPL